METIYVATMETSEQITPDDFRVIHPSMQVTATTTVEEIHKFFLKHEPRGKFEVRLNELEII